MPIHSDPKAQFLASLAAMLIGPDRFRFTFNSHVTHGLSIIGEARDATAEGALAGDPDALLWLDSDQTFPPDTLSRLVAHDLPIVGCNYRRRNPSQIPVSSATKLVGGTLLPITPLDSGMEEVDAIGFGVCLIKSDVFRALPRPWFGAGAGGEDAYFCQQAKAAGFSVMVDHSLSMEVGHIAEMALYFPR